MSMEIWGCQCLKRIKIFSLPKLVEIKVHNNDLERFELEESNLHYLCITEKHISELKLLPLKNLKKLCLDMPNLTEQWLHYHLSGLPLLETLELTSCYMLKRIKRSSHHHLLKSLGLSSCDNLVDVMVDSPILCRLSYYNTSDVAISILLNASDLLEVKYVIPAIIPGILKGLNSSQRWEI